MRNPDSKPNFASPRRGTRVINLSFRNLGAQPKLKTRVLKPQVLGSISKRRYRKPGCATRVTNPDLTNPGTSPGFQTQVRKFESWTQVQDSGLLLWISTIYLLFTIITPWWLHKTKCNNSDVCRDQNMHLVGWLGYQRQKSRELVYRCAVFRKPLTFDHVEVHKKPTPDWVYFANTEGYIYIVSPKVTERLWADHRHMGWRENR